MSPKPGDFRATCRLVTTHWVDRGELPEEVQEALAHLGAPISHPVAEDEAERRREWSRLVQGHHYSAKHHGYRLDVACDFGTTTDREAFETHMREAHAGGLFRYEDGSLEPRKERRPENRRTHTLPVPIPVKAWRGPRLTLEGRPFKPSTKALAETLRTCDRCGLVAEVDGRPANAQWWREHLGFCAGQVRAS